MIRKVLAVIVVVQLISNGHSQMLDNATCEEYVCTECYNLLVYNLLKYDKNQYNMTRVFFPPDDATPVSVIVYYDFRDSEKIINKSKQKIWFWTSSNFYHFIPISVLQYLSLFFTDPSLRVSRLNITLDSECAGASDDYMQLLTQRLKLYTVNFEILPTITEDYNSKATGDSAMTITNHSKTARRYILSYSVMLWGFSVVVTFCTISFYLFSSSHDYYYRILQIIKGSKTKAWEVRTQMFTIMTISIIVNLYSLGMNITALAFKESKVNQEFNDWYHDVDTNFYNLNYCLLYLDFIAIIYATILLGVAYVCSVGKKEAKYVIPYYFLLIPIAIVASRIGLIIIGFMQNAFHATGVAVTYCIIIFTCIATLQIVSHLFRKIHSKLEDSKIECYSSIIKCVSPTCAALCGLLAFIILTTIILSAFVYVIALFFLIPINIAFDEAPNEILTVYQSIVVLSAGFLVYWILLRLYKSPLDILIQAKDSIEHDFVSAQRVTERRDSEQHGEHPQQELQQPPAEPVLHSQTLFKDWKTFSDVEKESKLAEALFKILQGFLNTVGRKKSDDAILVKSAQ